MHFSLDCFLTLTVPRCSSKKTWKSDLLPYGAFTAALYIEGPLRSTAVEFISDAIIPDNLPIAHYPRDPIYHLSGGVKLKGLGSLCNCRGGGKVYCINISLLYKHIEIYGRKEGVFSSFIYRLPVKISQSLGEKGENNNTFYYKNLKWKTFYVCWKPLDGLRFFSLVTQLPGNVPITSSYYLFKKHFYLMFKEHFKDVYHFK